MNHQFRRFVPLLALGLLAHAAPAFAKPSPIYTPKPGTKERKAILDALRKPVARFNKREVIFSEVNLKVSNGWAYVEAYSVDKKGKRVGPEYTNYVSALLETAHGSWRVLQWAYATDVISIDWEKKYPAVPRKLWPHRRL